MMKAAIVGCGNIAQVHAECIKETENAELTAAADIRPDRAAAFSKKYGVEVYDDYRSLLDREDIDVMHICTPHFLHTPMASEALARGVNVFMEKPPVINQRQAEELRAAAKNSSALLGFCFQNRFNPTTVRMKEMIDEARYGKLLGMRGIVSWSRMPDYYTGSEWRGQIDREGGGALINQSIHTLDLIQYITGEKPVSVDAVTANHHLKGVTEVEDMVSAYIAYPSSAAMLYGTTANCCNAPVMLEAECEEACLRIEGDKLTLRFPDGTEASETCRLQNHMGKEYWGAGHLECIRSFYSRLLNGSGTVIALSDIEYTVRLLLGIYASARNRDTVYL